MQDFTIRVCGEEILRILDVTPKFWILQAENGDPAAMPDAARYLTIPEATFAAYFDLNPAGDLCNVNSYELITDYTESQVTGLTYTSWSSLQNGRARI